MKKTVTNAATMAFPEVMAQLKEWGSENARKTNARQGAGGNQFGVTLGNLRTLARRLKTKHVLALQLWATGNADAMVLATMLMDPALLSAQAAEAMIQPITYVRLLDEFVDNVVAKSAFADELRSRWVDSPKEMVGRAGWNLLIARIVDDRNEGLDFDAILKKIEDEILSAPKRKQESMNRCLVEIGVHVPGFTKKCVDLGKRLGRFDQTPVPKGWVSSYAPEWIAAVLKRKK